MTRSPVPVTIVTGFLGAGKTTLLNVLLRRPALRRAAVIVNEFGPVGIDHLLVDTVLGDMLMLTTGCICCAARGDLVSALGTLLGRRQRGEIDVDWIVIETTGLAEPGPILDAILLDGALRAACRLAGCITLVDARAGSAALAPHEEALHQIVAADAIVLTKTDLDPECPLAARPEFAAWLHGLNPAAPLLIAQDVGAVVAAVTAPHDRPAPDLYRPAAYAATAGHGAQAHRHDGIEAVCLEAGTLDPAMFDSFLTRLIDRHGAALLRIKGLVASRADPDHPVVVHAVGARLHPSERLERWPSPDRRSRLVVIGRGLAPGVIADLWAAYFGPPAIDRPDAAALSAHGEGGPGLF